MTALFGGRAEINCSTNDNTATITLWKNSSPRQPNQYHEVLPDGDKVSKGQSGIFRINQVELKDASQYRCKAEKAGRSIQKNVRVIINKCKYA